MKIEDLTNEDGLLVRSVQIRAAADSELMEFTGIGVPYGEIYDTGYGYRETFDAGAISNTDAKVYYRHGEVIGRVHSTAETAAGHQITGRISDTQVGRDAWTLLKDGAIDSLSIGFKPVAYREDEDGVFHITEAIAREFSLVPNPAYTEAKITNFRSAQTTRKAHTVETEALTRADIAPINDALEVMKRDMAMIGQNNDAGPAAPQFRSMGEFVKAIAAGDSDAADFHRAYTGATTADGIVKDSFIGNFINLVEERRRITNTFQQAALPATGMNVEYGKLVSDTTQVGKQAAQGDDLLYGKVQIGTATAPVETYGGYTELSLQAIQRMSVPVLDTTFKAMALKYAKQTEAAVRALYKAVITANLAGTADEDWLALPAAATPDEYLDLIVDGSELLDEKGFALHGIHVSKDVFKKLIRLKDGDNRLMTVQGTGVNQVGTLNLSTVNGSLAGVNVALLPTAAANTLAFYDNQAIETLESPGAPAQLQDENIINLTKAFSIYGHMAVTNPFPGAIIPTKPAA